MKSFVKDEYLANARETDGLLGVPNGKSLYESCLRVQTSLKDITAEEVHQIGLQEVADLRKNVSILAEKLGKGDLSFKDFVKSVQV